MFSKIAVWNCLQQLLISELSIRKKNQNIQKSPLLWRFG